MDELDVTKDFPVLARRLRGDKRLVYLDSAATSQRPVQVLDAMDTFARTSNANVHRGVHQLAEEATKAYIGAHDRVASFVGLRKTRDVVFTKNCTEAINLVAFGWGLRRLGPDDEVLLTEMEHHANIVPWHAIAKLTKAKVRFAPITDEGELDLEAFQDMLSSRTKLVSVAHVSNVLGTINPVRELTELAHDAGARILVDGAQSVPHRAVDVRAIGCDWLAFSGHKMLGPTGIGCLVGTEDAFEETEPLLYGGEMIKRVTFEGAEWNERPWRYEAGTPMITEAIGLAAAIDYLEAIGMDRVAAHDEALVRNALERLVEAGCEVHGPPAERRVSVVSFNVPGIHPHDLASIVDDDGVAIRAGHHCAMPLMAVLGVPATARASFYIYNSQEDIDMLVTSIERARRVMGLE